MVKAVESIQDAGDEWSTEPEEIRKIVEELIASGDRILIVGIERLPGNGGVKRTALSVSKRSNHVSWAELIGTMYMWLQEWAHGDFDH